MKKFSVILLVAILAMACVFADPVTIDATINGTATASYAIGLDKGTLEYGTTDLVPVAPNTTNFKITLNAVTKSSIASEVYGLLGAKIAFTNFNAALTLTDFAIVKTDAWKINFLGGELAGLAGSPIVTTTNNVLKATESKLASKTTAKALGIEFTWNLNAKQAFTFVGAANREANKYGSYVLAAKTPVFVLVEGETDGVNALDIQGVGGFAYSDAEGWYFAGSVAMNSTSNVAKVAVAADNELLVKDSKATYNMEAELDASFAPVAKDAAGKDVYFADLKMYTYKEAAKRLVLDAKTTFRTYVFSGDVAPVELSVSCMNILASKADANKRNLSVDAKVTIAKNYEVGAYAHNVLYNGATVPTTGPASREVGVTGSITIGDPKLVDDTYGLVNTAKVYYATGDKKIGYVLGATYNDAWLDSATITIANSYVINGTKDLTITAGAKTTHLVDNATIALNYVGGNLLDKKVGTLTASCEVSF